jgi:hypothetical protein
VKLAFLGPAPPFRGGIVTYFGMLGRSLIERGHLLFWASFKKQYPGWLFPGSEQEGETADQGKALQEITRQWQHFVYGKEYTGRHTDRDQ